VFRFTAGKVSGDHRIPVISGRSTVDTPTACPVTAGPGAQSSVATWPPRRTTRPGGGWRSSRRPPECSREALEEFRAAGRLQPPLAGSLALGGQATGWLLATQARLGW